MRDLLIKAFRGQFLVEILVRLRGFLLLPIATRALGPEGYGWVAFAAAVTGLVGSIATLGIPSALSRFLPGKETPKERAQVFWPAFGACVASLLVCAGLTAIAGFTLPIVPSGLPASLVVLAAVNVISAELKLLVFNYFRL